MTTDKRDGGELLPLPEPDKSWGGWKRQMQAYARANMERALSESRALLVSAHQGAKEARTDRFRAVRERNVAQRELSKSRAECVRLQDQADWCGDALRIEIGQFVGANATLEALTIRACNDLARYKARAERLAGALLHLRNHTSVNPHQIELIDAAMALPEPPQSEER